MTTQPTMTVDGRSVPIDGGRNLLEVLRKANLDIPTFCYHSDLSVYGACRLCLVDVQGRGLQASCSVPAEAGLVVRTNTPELREMRRVTLELLLANHHQECPTCPKNGSCQLQDLARRLGVTEVRFKPATARTPCDESSPALCRDPNKCVLCGDCVRFCHEIQGVGAIDFTHRGSRARVAPAFNKGLGDVECVHCGQCAAVCPTGAITPRSQVDDVWKLLDDPGRTVVAQIAPAVRVALGERFGMKPGATSIGQIVAALKMLGFARVFDTAFTADLTVIEEATEFLHRKAEGGALPQFTSCCPAWVRFAEQYYPDLLPNVSTCRSPQQMFGSLAREVLPAQLAVAPERLAIVSIMPCTAKKYEAAQAKFAPGGRPDVDVVLTTQELARMIEAAGIRFDALQPESLDLPLGFKTGAGVIFGASGGVSEAVLRFAAEKLGGVTLDAPVFQEVRGMGGLREATVTAGGHTLRLAVVHGLRNARQVAELARAGRCPYDLGEVMACPGGCVGGAGQPVSRQRADTCRRRADGLYEADKMLQLHKSQENPYVRDLYARTLGDAGGNVAHRLLHTHYQGRRRLEGTALDLNPSAQAEPRVEVRVCVGTSCYVRGSQKLLNRLIRHVEDQGLTGTVAVGASFCFEHCDRGPTVRVGESILEACTFERACDALDAELAAGADRPGKELASP